MMGYVLFYRIDGFGWKVVIHPAALGRRGYCDVVWIGEEGVWDLHCLTYGGYVLVIVVYSL